MIAFCMVFLYHHFLLRLYMIAYLHHFLLRLYMIAYLYHKDFISFNFKYFLTIIQPKKKFLKPLFNQKKVFKTIIQPKKKFLKPLFNLPYYISTNFQNDPIENMD